MRAGSLALGARRLRQAIGFALAGQALIACASMAEYSDPYVQRAEAEADRSSTLSPSQFLAEAEIESPYHSVRSVSPVNGADLIYEIETDRGIMHVLGTEQTKTRIREIRATEILRSRSTAGTMLEAAWDRTTNLVETPYRLGESLIERAENVETGEDLVLFVPRIVGDVGSGLIRGLGEFVVTGLRITRSAAGTSCSGTGCLNQIGEDIRSGANSLAGKHNVARTLHAEFGTDPETLNRTYRRQVDRVSYASAYTSTTIKLGAGQGGVQYVSPAFTYVGFYNNAEFVGQYEDAHRQRNREKAALLSWGAQPDNVEKFYRNKAFTKTYRRRLFSALNRLPDKADAIKLFSRAANMDSRYKAEGYLILLDYLADQTGTGHELILPGTENDPLLRLTDGTLLLPLQADYLQWTDGLENRLKSLGDEGQPAAIHVLGPMDPKVRERANDLGIRVY